MVSSYSFFVSFFSTPYSVSSDARRCSRSVVLTPRLWVTTKRRSIGAAKKKRREDEPAGEPGDEDEEGEVGDHHQEHPGPDAQ